MIIPLMTFVLVFAICYGGYSLFVVRPEEQMHRSVAMRLRSSKPVARLRTTRLLKETQAMSAVSVFDRALRRTRGIAERLQNLIEQADVRMSVATLLLTCGCLALITYGAAELFIGWVLLSIPLALVVAYVPILVLKYRRTLRLRKFEEQFPEALDLLSRALRAGHSFTTGIDMVANEMTRPIGPEFRTLHDQQNYGMGVPEALSYFAQRVPLLDARFFVTAVLIQRESGGNLSEVLDNLASVMRDRFRVKRQMRVLSAHGRITGWVLVGLPPVLGTALMIVNPEHRQVLFGDPLGQQLVIAAVVLQTVGSLIIRKIVDVEY